MLGANVQHYFDHELSHYPMIGARLDRQRTLGGIARIIALAAMLLSCTAWPAEAQLGCSFDFPHDFNPSSVADADICNFHQVDEILYRGGRPRRSAYPKLVELGVRTIISLEETASAEQEEAAIDELNSKLSAEQKIDFISFPITPRETEQTGVPHERMVQLFEQIRNSRHPIFIHCYHGKDRTGAVVALYRMRTHEKTFKEAYDEAYHYLFQASDLGLRKTIDRYESFKNLQTLPRPH